MSQTRSIAVVIGVGPGTGASITRRFARGGYTVALLARNRERLAQLAQEAPGTHAYQGDVTMRRSSTPHSKRYV